MQSESSILKVTESALGAVVDARSTEPDPEGLALWIEVNGEAGGSYTYDVYFEEVRDASEGDEVVVQGEIPFVLPRASVEQLKGATLDLDPTSGLVIINPNSPARPAGPAGMEFPPEALQSDVAQRVIAVLADEINPSIASHGGRADLMGVVDNVAYLQLSGGCQGCGLASVTLSEGISVAITQAVPEIKEVKDVTDHASGSDPYFAGAKK